MAGVDDGDAHRFGGSVRSMSVSLPTRDSELRHIFSDRSGHIEDTPENRELLVRLANDVTARLESDQHGNIWAARPLPDGRQVWVWFRGEKIVNGGINETARAFHPKTGLNRP